MTTSPLLIALDWGTSSLRGYLLGEGGRVLETATRPWGIMATPDGDFGRALATLTEAWRGSHPGLPMIATGMIGSAQGWREIPYIHCPAGHNEIAAAVERQVRDGPDLLPIVPGLMLEGAIPNVMRGEETQIVGVLERKANLASRSRLVLPGTHSKWVTVEDGRILDFETYMTGELFGVLSKHSILGRPALQAGTPASDGPRSWDAFDRGLLTIRDNPARSLSALLFSARTLVLSRQLPADQSLDYLSGLLLGEEVRAALSARRRSEDEPLVLIGDDGLCRRYQRALDLFGFTGSEFVDEAAPAGLWRIARTAGLVASARGL